MKSSARSRRKFLRNTALTASAFAITPLKGTSKAVDVSLCNATTLDYYGQGPFYTVNPPDIQSNQLAEASEAGTRLIISGVVKTLDCTEMIPNTKIDIWHANDAGAYDNSGYNLRGVTYSNLQGFYLFETILPGKYLNGNLYRPSHIHFKITPTGYPTLTTQLYFEGDTDIPADAAASLTTGNYDASERIIPIIMNSDSKYEGVWDIIVDGEGTSTGMNDLHISHGIIYYANSQANSGQVEIFYGVFQKSKISLDVFNLAGHKVATLEDETHDSGKYTAMWRPDHSLPAGVYFVALQVNDLQVHYLKVLKE